VSVQECTNTSIESVYATIQSAHPQCTAEMQSISETDSCPARAPAPLGPGLKEQTHSISWPDVMEGD